MQIQLTLRPDKELTIPYNYAYQLQSALYALLSQVNDSDFWHDEGYGAPNRYKGFCFSEIKGKRYVNTENRKLCFAGEVHLEVRSPVFDFMDSFQRAVERHPFLTLFDTRLDVVGAALTNVHYPSGTTCLRAETPVVLHSTAEDGHTVFYGPTDEDYCRRLSQNILKKYEAITGRGADALFVSLNGEYRKIVTKYKGFYLSGYTGFFDISTSVRMLEFIYNAGLGEKNAQGFGFVSALKQGGGQHEGVSQYPY